MNDKTKRSLWKCRCDCGGEKVVSITQLTTGHTRSCGCLPKRVPVDLTGRVFGRLVVVEQSDNRRGRVHWTCRCECGNTKSVAAKELVGGGTRSCGCLCMQLIEKLNKTHGMSRRKEYRIWRGMKERCLDENSRYFHHYGGRGIFVCERWIDSFENFYADMGPKPPGMSIDRIDNDGPYSPDNCRWATQKEQTRNTRRTRLLTWNGQTLCLSDWSKITGISRKVLKKRLDVLKWSAEKTLTTPSGKR